VVRREIGFPFYNRRLLPGPTRVDERAMARVQEIQAALFLLAAIFVAVVLATTLENYYGVLPGRD